MVLRLARIVTHVRRDPIARLRDTHLLSDLRDRFEHPRDDRPVLISNVSRRRDMLLRDREEVDGRLSPRIAMRNIDNDG